MMDDQGWCIDDTRVKNKSSNDWEKLCFLKKNYVCTVRKIRYRKLRGSFEMHTKGYGRVNKFIQECESVLWWNLHLSMVSYFHLGVTREKINLQNQKKVCFCCLNVSNRNSGRPFWNAHQRVFLCKLIFPKAWVCYLGIIPSSLRLSYIFMVTHVNNKSAKLEKIM